MRTKGKKFSHVLPPTAVTPDTRQKLERIALAREASMSEVIRAALELYLPLQPESQQHQLERAQ